MKHAFLFPGQGAQYGGMGKDLAERFDSVRDVYKRAGERKVHLRRIGKGEVFGETAILTSGRRSASVVAVDQVTALVVTREALEQEIDSRGWLGPLVKALAARFIEADEERVRLRAGMDVGVRVEGMPEDDGG